MYAYWTGCFQKTVVLRSPSEVADGRGISVSNCFFSILRWRGGIPHLGLNIDPFPVCSRKISRTSKQFAHEGFFEVHVTVFIVNITNTNLIDAYLVKCCVYIFHSAYGNLCRYKPLLGMTGAKAEPNLQKCHVANLGAPNGHVNKHKIQMRSIFFFRGANSLVISVVLQCFVVNCS